MFPHPDTATVILDSRHQENLRFAERQRLAATALATVPQTRTLTPVAQLLAAWRYLGQRLGRVKTAVPTPLRPLTSGDS
jgi:hypothetical protein